MFVASFSFSSLTNVYFIRWVFWFRQQRAPGNKITNYEEGIKKIASFSSVESFWGLQTHLSPPSALLPTTDYLLFHAGVRRPVWEDPLNRAGGKWIVRLRKGVADRIWEDLVMGVVGDMFDECGTQGEGEDGGWPEICGCTISVRQSEDIVSLWNRVDGDAKVREKIRCVFRFFFRNFNGLIGVVGTLCALCSTFLHRPSWSINLIMVRSLYPLHGSPQ
jgi:translation initiation factor 4E